MTMSTQIQVASLLAGANVVLLLGLGAVWVRNYRTFRTPMVLGLVAFAGVLLLENLVALYFFFSMKMLYAADPGVHSVVAILRGLEFVAVLILAWVTAK